MTTAQMLENQIQNEHEDQDSLNGYRNQLKHRLDEERANLETTQDQVSRRVQDDAGMDVLCFADVSQERADILSIVRSLERQADTSIRLKDVLESDLESVQKRLSVEMTARAELEEKIKCLEADSDSVDQIQKENSSLKEERDKLGLLIAEVRPQLASITEARDSLAEEVVFARARIKELGAKKADLEIQMRHLQDKVSDTERMRTELSKITDERRALTEQVRRLMSRLEEANKIRDTLEADLASSHEAVCNLRKEMESLQDRTTGDDNEVSNLRNQLIAQGAELAAANERIQQEIAARRQTEEMLRDIKSRLVSLSQKKPSHMPASQPGDMAASG